MTRAAPFTQASAERAIKAALKTGLRVTNKVENPDGSITISLDDTPPSKPHLSIVPSKPIDPRARSMDQGFVYFVSDGEFIKIGFATDWQARIKGLQIANPRTLTPLLILEGGYRFERQLHQLFKAHRVRGEWFRLSPEIAEYVNDHETESLYRGELP
jgi:hypothetical protein